MEEETKHCANCKRDIPSLNYIIHSVHCARNIKMCNVCKEPVATSELSQHHKANHEVAPCKQCGEGVCGTDLEDHLRDSCAHTVQPCRYCELELPRVELPEHLQYCGTRTEKCDQCGEIIMIKYIQLHLDSNHSFIKLDDETGPSPSWSKYTNTNKSTKNVNNIKKNTRNDTTEFGSIASINDTDFMQTIMGPSTSSGIQNNQKKQPEPKSSTQKSSLKPLNNDSNRESPHWSAHARNQKEEKARCGQKQYSEVHGVPQVFNSAQELEKLSYLSQLQNMDCDKDYRSNRPLTCKSKQLLKESPPRQVGHFNNMEGLNNLTPMSGEEFIERFQRLQTVESSANAASSNDRFSNIKTELQQLRRGINEVTSPFNTNNIIIRPANNINLRNNPPTEPASRKDNILQSDMPLNGILLPCEFCHQNFSLDNFILHETGCRPDLCRRDARASPTYSNNDELHGRGDHSPNETVIPCEFCMIPYPIDELILHQSGCLVSNT